MIDLEFRLKLLQAKIECELTEGESHHFWVGYIMGLKKHKEFSLRDDWSNMVRDTTVGLPAFRRAGYAEGIYGKSVSDADETLQALLSTNYLGETLNKKGNVS